MTFASTTHSGSQVCFHNSPTSKSATLSAPQTTRRLRSTCWRVKCASAQTSSSACVRVFRLEEVTEKAADLRRKRGSENLLSHFLIRVFLRESAAANNYFWSAATAVVCFWK